MESIVEAHTLAKRTKVMANSYTQVHIHFVFVVAGRQCLIEERNRPVIESFMCGVIERFNSKAIAVYCNPDQCHLLVGMHPSISIADLVKNVKALTAKWINDKRLTAWHFNWQAGYGAFACSKHELRRVVKYIHNQPIHHGRQSMLDEYKALLVENQVDFDERYLFTEV